MNFPDQRHPAKIKGTYEGVKRGVRIADVAQRKSNLNIQGGLGYGQSILRSSLQNKR
jgi:hypothetical protein